MSKLFNIFDEKFFSLLSAPNRALYFDCILEIYQRVDELESTQENTKEKIISEIEYLIESRGQIEIYEEDAGELSDIRSKARYIVNHIKDCGWIFEEDLGHNVILINFYAHASRMVRILKEILASTQLEYTGYIKNIYLLTQDLSHSKEIAIIEQMYKQTDELISNLKSLKSTIFTYYNNLIKKALFENAHQILDELLRYKGEFFDKQYSKLKTYDNLSKYKDAILNTIQTIRISDELMDSLIIARIDDTYPTDESAEQYIIEKLDFVVDAFSTVDRLIRTIDDKNNKYIQAAISKVMFFVNRSDDFEGIFNKLMELINEKKIEYGSDFYFNLFSTKNIDKSSLYTARDMNRNKVEVEKLIEYEVDKEFARDKYNEFFISSEYSFNNINKYAKNLLEGKVKVRASDISIENNQQLVKLFLIYLYSKSKGRNYNLTLTDKKVIKKGFKFNDFILTEVKYD